ncbi:hypothetical protein [Streptococcus ferus]|uniref:hypothetical protein n=1 Tax=Streptococcus ferus TaxID=1345 RepID=UPI0035A0F935
MDWKSWDKTISERVQQLSWQRLMVMAKGNFGYLSETTGNRKKTNPRPISNDFLL